MFGIGRGRPRRGRSRLTLLVAAASLALAVGAVDAGGAAALGEQCSGSNISGEGSYLQTPAQLVWNSGGSGSFNASGNETACNGSQGSGGKPKAPFTSVGSGPALHGWGADDGIFHHKGVALLATDVAPAGPVGEVGTQLARMKKALGSDLVVAPLTQTAIAIAAHPPALPAHPACVVGQMTQADVEGVFSGQLTNWRQLATASDPEAGGNCDQAITRVVREEGSGTTYQFKHYLDQLDPEPLECSGESPRTWAQLQSVAEPAEANLDWPRKADCQEGEGPVSVVATVGEGVAGPLGFVKSNPGTITYADLPNAKSYAPEQIVDVYNGLEFVDPADGEKNARCGLAEYALPEGWAEGVNVDWSQVYGSNPEVAEKGAYPLCTLTWAVAAADSGGVFGNKAGTTVRDYLLYAHEEEAGQQALLGHYYDQLPKEVASAAAVALAEIGGEGEEEEGGGGGTGTVLCKVEPEVKAETLACPAGEGYAGKLFGNIVPGSEATFTGSEGAISCNKAGLSGLFNEDGTTGAEGVYGLAITDSSGFCASTFPLGEVAKVEIEKPVFDASKFVYLAMLAPQGSFVLAKKGSQPYLWVRFGEEGVPACFYGPTFLSGQVVNGSPTKLLMNASWELLEGFSEGCSGTLEQTTKFNLSRPEPESTVYVAGE